MMVVMMIILMHTGVGTPGGQVSPHGHLFQTDLEEDDDGGDGGDDDAVDGAVDDAVDGDAGDNDYNNDDDNNNDVYSCNRAA
jgi:hypothetical protein